MGMPMPGTTYCCLQQKAKKASTDMVLLRTLHGVTLELVVVDANAVGQRGLVFLAVFKEDVASMGLGLSHCRPGCPDG